MPRRSFFMYPVNNHDDPNNDDNDLLALGSFNIFDNMIMNGLIWTWNQLKRLGPALSWTYSVCGYYIMWILLHYAAIHLYPEFCAPYTILGFLLSPFMVSAPHCVAMRWLVNEGANVIITMWVAIGAYAIQLMLRRPNNV